MSQTPKENEAVVPVSSLADWDKRLTDVLDSGKTTNNPVIKNAMKEVEKVRDSIQELLLSV